MNKILKYLESAAQRFPNKVVFGDDTMTIDYHSFVDISKRIGTAIAKTNLQLCPIMIMMKKTPYTLAAFFGVMYSRNIYVPIDIEMPDERLWKIVNNLAPEYIICDDDNYEKARDILPENRILLFNTLANETINQDILDSISCSFLDIDPIYIIHTSGTTGVPKGVVAPLRALIDYLDAFCEVVKISENDVFGNQVPFHFDGSLIDIYCTIRQGASMYIIPPTFFAAPMKLAEFLSEKRITAIRWISSALKMISIFNIFSICVPAELKTVMFVGEIMPVKCYNYWRQYLPNTTFIQFYGPTEATGVCTYFVANRSYTEGETIPIGKPLPNSKVFLLGENNEIISRPNVLGELCVGGTCLSLGYYNMKEKTESAFVQNPTQNYYSETIYLTGDIAKYNDDGNLVFVGRKDYQIKHMGYRIELGEIEVVALSIEGVSDVACIYDDKTDRIVLFYVSNTGLAKKELKNILSEKLCTYMQPNKLYLMEQMPKTSTGKIDRKLLKDSIINNIK